MHSFIRLEHLGISLGYLFCAKLNNHKTIKKTFELDNKHNANIGFISVPITIVRDKQSSSK